MAEESITNEVPWTIKIKSVKGLRVDFTYRALDKRDGVEALQTKDRFAFIEPEEDDPVICDKVYDIVYRRDVIGHAKFNERNPDGGSKWQVDLFNVDVTRC